MSALKILIADDHDIVRTGMKALLEDQPGWQVVAEAGTGRQAVEKAKLTTPDVVVLDVTMPELNGLEAARQIKKALPNIEILILTVHESEQIASEVLKVGARGYILKSDAGRELVAAVKSVAAHKNYFTSRISQMVSDSTLREGANGTTEVTAVSLVNVSGILAQMGRGMIQDVSDQMFRIFSERMRGELESQATAALGATAAAGTAAAPAPMGTAPAAASTPPAVPADATASSGVTAPPPPPAPEALDLGAVGGKVAWAVAVRTLTSPVLWFGIAAGVVLDRLLFR